MEHVRKYIELAARCTRRAWSESDFAVRVHTIISQSFPPAHICALWNTSNSTIRGGGVGAGCVFVHLLLVWCPPRLKSDISLW